MTRAEMGKVHVSKYSTYHPDPNASVAWTVNDTRGYIDGGPSCDECGMCDCDTFDAKKGCCADTGNEECIGLDFAFICLDGGESLCEDCAASMVDVVPCDCE